MRVPDSLDHRKALCFHFLSRPYYYEGGLGPPCPEHRHIYAAYRRESWEPGPALHIVHGRHRELRWPEMHRRAAGVGFGLGYDHAWYVRTGYMAYRRYDNWQGDMIKQTVWNPDGTVFFQWRNRQTGENEFNLAPPWLWGVTDRKRRDKPAWSRG